MLAAFSDTIFVHVNQVVREKNTATIFTSPDRPDMQIFVRSATDSSPEETFMIEMQGDLESRNKEQLEGKFIGDLHYTKDGTPVMIIGHHILYGKVIELEKPLVTLDRIQVDKNIVIGEGEEMMDVDSHMEDPKTEYRVKSIIYKKIMFKTRPKPIIVMNKSADS